MITGATACYFPKQLLKLIEAISGNFTRRRVQENVLDGHVYNSN